MPLELPDLIHDDFSCRKCYSNRECFTYDAAKCFADEKEQTELGSAFTKHLKKDELEYFLKWDRLINLEVHSEGSNIARSWLLGSEEFENDAAACISSLVFDAEKTKCPTVNMEDHSGGWIVAFFSRNVPGPLADSLPDGTRVVLSMDVTTLQLSSKKKWNTITRPQMHVARGDVCELNQNHIGLRLSRDDLLRIEKLASNTLPSKLHFRLDRDIGATGVGTLRQNLINLLSGDKKTNSEPGTTVEGSRLPRLRDLLLKLEAPVFDDDWKVEMMFQRPLSSPSVAKVPSCDLATLELEFGTLNLDQQSAVRKVFVANDYTLIQGLPGTGK